MIDENPQLSSLAGMTGLMTIGDDLQITDNVSLATFEAEAFAATKDVGGSTIIDGNMP